MKIVLHMGTLRSFGTALVGQEVLRQFTNMTEHEISAWIPSAWDWNERATGATNLRRTRPGIRAKLFTENVSMRYHLRRSKPDRLFSLTDTSMPICPVPHLLLVHQAYVLSAREYWCFDMPRAFRVRMRLIREYFRVNLPTVTKLTVQTEFMRQQAVRVWGMAPERVVVIPSSVDGALSERPIATPEYENPQLCYLAGDAPQKNHAVLAPMIACLSKRHPSVKCHLTVRSEQVPTLVVAARKLNVLRHFVFRGSLSHREAMDLLRGSVATVLPSKLESFGIPYYEAMAVGCPVVCSDLPFAREACGETAAYADPDSGHEFALKVEELIDSPSRRTSAAQKGRDRFDKINISWAEVARRYLALLESM